jgi:hypothetical protein
MRALSIRQPYAEEIMRKIKKIEYRDHTNGVRIGEKFYIYAAANVPDEADLRGYSKLCKTRKKLKEAGFPTRVLVGTARISKITQPTRAKPHWHWHLYDVRRIRRPIKPKKHAQPSWFYPF